MESRSVLWPWIDTRQAPGYSESAFHTIRVGMTRHQVDALMGPPLWVVTVPQTGGGYQTAAAGDDLDVGVVRYSYTADGRCAWGDFAWFGREVWFMDGIVTEVFSEMYYD